MTDYDKKKIVHSQIINTTFEGLRMTLLNEKGFTLIELLIAIVIVGILATIAVPKYLSVTRKAKETEAKMMLSQIHALQEAYYYENDIYCSDLAELGFDHEKLITEGGRARFKITIEKADLLSYTVLATAVVDFDKDGTYSVWEVKEDGKILQIVTD